METISFGGNNTKTRVKTYKDVSIGQPIVMQAIHSIAEFEAARQRHDVVVFDFYATWCGPCKALAPQLEALAAASVGKAGFYKVDVDDLQTVADLYQISAMPTILILKKGQVFGRVQGANLAAIQDYVRKATA